MNKKIFGLIGYPLGHSFSRDFFSKKFSNENINAEYLNFEIDDISKFNDIIKKNSNIYGLNVTIPYKSAIIHYLDEVDETAKNIGAVNVIKFIRSGNSLRLKGYNSDIIGFTNSISPLLKEHNNKALILGTGGVSKAIKYALNKIGIDTLFVSRNKKENSITYTELSKDIMNEYSVIVNASPVGMYPNIDTAPDIPYEFITNKHVVFDTIYNPEETLFMKMASKNGAIVKNGLEMLIGQAIAAWEIWNSEH